MYRALETTLLGSLLRVIAILSGAHVKATNRVCTFLLERICVSLVTVPNTVAKGCHSLEKVESFTLISTKRQFDIYSNSCCEKLFEVC